MQTAVLRTKQKLDAVIIFVILVVFVTVRMKLF